MRVKNIESFIERAKIVHNNKYMYHRFSYTVSVAKSDVFCPFHGYFLCSAANHIKGKGCPKCARIRTPQSLISSKYLFLEKCVSIHGKLYDYSKSDYKGANTKIEIICKIHGSFWQTPNNHIHKIHHCGKCLGIGLSKKEKIIILKTNSINTKFTNYSKAKINKGECTELFCTLHEKYYTQNYYNHLKYLGCPFCKRERRSSAWNSISSYGTNGFYGTDKKSFIYILSNEDDTIIKVGLAKNIKYRMNDLYKESGILWKLLSSYQDKANILWEIEQDIHKTFDSLSMDGLQFRGKSECYSYKFLRDILKRMTITKKKFIK